MIGHIESYDIRTQTGVIKSEEKFYGFHLDNWEAQVPPESGDDVKFECDNETAAIHVNLVGAYLEPPKAIKYKYLATVLALFLGPVGAHRYYLGFYRLGFAQLALTIILFFGGLMGFAFLWSFIDTILLFGGYINKDSKGRPLK